MEKTYSKESVVGKGGGVTWYVDVCKKNPNDYQKLKFLMPILI